MRDGEVRPPTGRDSRGPGRQTISGRPIQTVYDAGDLAGWDPAVALGSAGAYPFTRGIHAKMYRRRVWTMRQFAGFGTADETNERFHYLLRQGQTGLSVAFDLPTLMGRDSDDALSAGEVGRCGVAIDTLDDFRRLFRGIDLGAVSVSMTINAPAAILLAFYVALADETGVSRETLRGTCQNDILKEFHAQNEFLFPVRPSVNLVVDTIEFAAQELPQYNPVSISGYHIREAGSTAGQELAFTLADGMAYVQACVDRGMAVDAFGPRLSFFFNCHNDFFEEIAKFRAARRVWAKVMRDRFGASKERSEWMRFHAQTAGCSLYNEQPYVNVIRVAYQALAAVLGGCQSLHTNSMDETFALPTESAVTLALRTQQVLACETGVANSVDPLGGSYQVEALTNELEALNMKKPIQNLRAFIVDLDGTTYLGDRLIPGADRFFHRLQETGKRFVFYTNNSSATPTMYLRKLRRLSIPVKPENILTSATATIMYLKRRNAGRRVFPLGTRSFENHLKREGFILTDHRCDYVVLAFDKTLTYKKLATACRLIQTGVTYIATHPDLVCPTPDGDIPDTGAMIECIAAATAGKRPKVIGKPNKTMLEMALALAHAKPAQTAVIGDRLYTDIKMANDNGLTSILVLSGETKRRPTRPPEHVPDYCFPTIGHIPV